MRIPGNVVEGKGNPFPQGVFVGRLAEVTEAASEDMKSLDYVLTVRDNTPIEGPQVGARPFTQRISIVSNEKSVVDIQEFTDDTPFPLVRAAGLIAQLALAFGYPVRISPDKSVEFTESATVEDFLLAFAGGTYKDRSLGFQVKHRAWKSKKTGSSGIAAEAVRFFSPDAQAETVAVVEGTDVAEEAIPPQEVAGVALRGLRSRS